MSDRIRDAAEKWWDENVMPSTVSWSEAKENLSTFIRDEVEAEQNGIINEFRKRTSTVQQQARYFHADEIENIIRIRKGGA